MVLIGSTVFIGLFVLFHVGLNLDFRTGSAQVERLGNVIDFSSS